MRATLHVTKRASYIHKVTLGRKYNIQQRRTQSQRKKKQVLSVLP